MPAAFASPTTILAASPNWRDADPAIPGRNGPARLDRTNIGEYSGFGEIFGLERINLPQAPILPADSRSAGPGVIRRGGRGRRDGGRVPERLAAAPQRQRTARGRDQVPGRTAWRHPQLCLCVSAKIRRVTRWNSYPDAHAECDLADLAGSVPDQIRRERACGPHKYSLGSERGLATPSPDGKGRDHLVPSLMIMPLDS